MQLQFCATLLGLLEFNTTAGCCGVYVKLPGAAAALHCTAVQGLLAKLEPLCTKKRLNCRVARIHTAHRLGAAYYPIRQGVCQSKGQRLGRANT